MRTVLLTLVQLGGVLAALYGLYLLLGLPWLLIVGGAIGAGWAVLVEAADGPADDLSDLDRRDGLARDGA